MSKVSRKITDVFNIKNLFEIDSEGDFTPIDYFTKPQWETDNNSDIMPSVTLIAEDEEYELDENNDIMPKE